MAADLALTGRIVAAPGMFFGRYVQGEGRAEINDNDVTL
jgi:hypothetical protein